MDMVLLSGNTTVKKYGTYEITFTTRSSFGNPYFDVSLKVIFIRPDGVKIAAEGFYDGGYTFKVRAYCNMVGTWQWKSISNHVDLHDKTGSFHVVPSQLKGKLKAHPQDPYQFAYENGEWFLHIGDTGYRYVAGNEPNWKEYFDQAVISGMTKIRVWLCQDRSTIQGLFQNDRKRLNIECWKEIDKRLVYSLNHYPEINIQLIPFGEDAEEVKRYGQGDEMSKVFLRHVQARFSSFANISWCVSNDLMLGEETTDAVERVGQDTGDKKALIHGIDSAATDLAVNEPWGTLITNHQSRFAGYMFVKAPWSHIVTLEDIGQVTGEKILQYRAKCKCPVVLDEDRYEHWRMPEHDRYFFRRFMWGSLLSGGHATYGGLKTYEEFDGWLSGMYGYYDACRDGKLEDGAHDFIQIHKFFADANVTLVGMIPDDNAAGNKPLLYKCMRNEDSSAYIIYLANPDNYLVHTPNKFDGYHSDAFANADVNTPTLIVSLPLNKYKAQWFNPTTGEWAATLNVDGGILNITAPGAGDWLLLLTKQ